MSSETNASGDSSANNCGGSNTSAMGTSAAGTMHSTSAGETAATTSSTASTGTTESVAATSATSSVAAGAESMTLRTLQQYRRMAGDPAKVEPLTRDGTVAQFLAYVLEDRDEAIVAEALHTIVLLCRAEASRRQLARTYGLVPALQCLKMKDSGAEVLALADQALGELQRPATAPSAAATFPTREKPRIPPRPKHKVVTLHVTGLVTDTDRDELESLLVRVRGMVSIVFDMGRGRCTCRVRDNVTVGTLGSAVDRTEAMAAYQVVKGAHPEDEELVPVSKRAKALERPAEKLPEYLPEDDGETAPGAGAVATEGFFKQASGWLSSASSYLSQSFYW